MKLRVELPDPASVTVSVRTERIPGDPRIRSLLPRCIAGAATPQEEALFRSLWQERVFRDDSEVVVVEDAGH